MGEIIDLEEYREKHIYSSAFREALDTVKKAGKEPDKEITLKGVEALDEHFKKHPFDFNKIKDTEAIKLFPNKKE